MTDITLVSDKVPAHVQKGSGLGNENITAAHLQTPRVKQLQQLSNEVDEQHSEHIEGAKVGDFINTVTRENYGQSIYVLNIRFTEEFVAWKKREKGGGLAGSFASKEDAIESLKSQDLNPEDYDITETHSHMLIRKNEESGNLDVPFLFDCASSKLRVSREWNTQIAGLSGDRFSSLWKMSSVRTENRTGQKFYNIQVEKVGWATDDDYNNAKTVFESIK
tara:strand:- start:6505 stop:7164 length:660 start_codon:yes stop_codon:yes gene_type:complete